LIVVTTGAGNEVWAVSGWAGRVSL